jgi:hypothetical protein
LLTLLSHTPFNAGSITYHPDRSVCRTTWHSSLPLRPTSVPYGFSPRPDKNPCNYLHAIQSMPRG